MTPHQRQRLAQALNRTLTTTQAIQILEPIIDDFITDAMKTSVGGLEIVKVEGDPSDASGIFVEVLPAGDDMIIRGRINDGPKHEFHLSRRHVEHFAHFLLEKVRRL